MSFTIQRAALEDISEILAIQDTHLLTHKTDLSDGFLVESIDEAFLREVITSPNWYAFTAKAENAVIGYMLAQDFTYYLDVHPDWFRDNQIPEDALPGARGIYGKHLASNHVQKGVGAALNSELLTQAKNDRYEFYLGDISEQPRNEVSLRKHQELGMKRIGGRTDTVTWGVYCLDLSDFFGTSENYI